MSSFFSEFKVYLETPPGVKTYPNKIQMYYLLFFFQDVTLDIKQTTCRGVLLYCRY